MRIVRWLTGANRRVVILWAALVAVLLIPTPAVYATDNMPAPVGDPGIQIIGGREATQLYPGMAQVYVPYIDGRTIFCGGFLTLRRDMVATGAHCVTQDFLPTPYPVAGMEVRVGSNELRGGESARVKEVRVYPGWDWGMGDSQIDDLAVLYLDHKIDAQPFGLLGLAGVPVTDTRLLGWGLTEWPPTAPPALAPMLREVDTTVQPLESCAHGFAGVGDVCVGTPFSGACFGDSGGPALRHLYRTWWAAFGITSREGSQAVCGTTVYTDLRYRPYATWLYRLAFSPGKIDPPMPVDGPTVSTQSGPILRWTRVLL